MVGEQLLSGACELLAVMVTIAQPKKREANPACTEPLAPPKNRQVSPQETLGVEFIGGVSRCQMNTQRTETDLPTWESRCQSLRQNVKSFEWVIMLF